MEADHFEIDNMLTLDSVGVSFFSMGDYDSDGDLDLFIAGQKSNGDVISKVYDNLEGIEKPKSCSKQTLWIK